MITKWLINLKKFRETEDTAFRNVSMNNQSNKKYRKNDNLFGKLNLESCLLTSQIYNMMTKIHLFLQLYSTKLADIRKQMYSTYKSSNFNPDLQPIKMQKIEVKDQNLRLSPIEQLNKLPPYP